MYSVSLDIDGSLTLGRFLHICDTYDVKLNDHILHGPGGGNPCLMFVSNHKKNLVDMIEKEWVDDAEYLASKIKKGKWSFKSREI